MNPKQNMLIANDRIITSDVVSCKYNNSTYQYDIKFKNGQIYHYNFNSVQWLKSPEVLNPAQYKISREGREFFGMTAIYLFSSPDSQYLHICFENGTERDYNASELKMVESCLNDAASKNVFDYLKEIADLVSLRAEDGTKLLSKQYEKLSFIEKDKAIVPYLNPQDYSNAAKQTATPIFPFGCNASQFKAVKAALENQISVIEGPPGTGKTQTILNIIANLLVNEKTVQVVSNNNSATTNVLEKLSSSKYGMGFIVAPLGNTENKESFIQEQTGQYPDLTGWQDDSFDEAAFTQAIQEKSMKLQSVFEKQERLAKAKLELQSLETEQKYFAQYDSETKSESLNIKMRKNVPSTAIMDLWQSSQVFSDTGHRLSLLFRLKSRLIYGISDWNFYKQDIAKIITAFQAMYYQSKHKELVDEISALQADLSAVNASDLLAEFSDLSMRYLKNSLFFKYGNKNSRPVFDEEDFFKNPSAIQREYPVVLSTTFSSRSSLCKDAAFDYLIMDEASQVDVATGALALSCAQNAVIVGDTKQLPNVVSENTRMRADTIFAAYQISKSYNFADKSLLKSVCELLSDIPKILLKEHYRCHPKIINFCNQKFYNSELVIMSEDNSEPDVLSVVKTVQGDHARGHMNQRQIDVICKEVLPEIPFSGDHIGIIAPYNKQVEALKTAVEDPATDIATVHKFQGREKDAIILSTVDNEVTDFSDDPYLLNVAVSRAKKKLCLVISGNEQPSDSNIGDLISYIEYNNFSVTESKLYSVFDYLYSQYTESRFAYLKKHRRISEHDSENLMYALLCDTVCEEGYTEWSVICHQPLNMLIRDPELLNDDECRYAMNPATHLDFLIYNRISKKPILAVEVDGYTFHKDGTSQAERDKMKNHILDLYHVPYLRFATNGSGEKEKLTQKLHELVSK